MFPIELNRNPSASQADIEDPQLFSFACPRCQTSLETVGRESLRCPADGSIYPKVDGIWRFLLPERLPVFQKFIQEYETVRRAEGRGSSDPASYRSLPSTPTGAAGPPGWLRRDWKVRSRTFLTFCAQILLPLEKRNARPLKIIDLGAGNGWLSHRLLLRGHHASAVDLLVNPWDGLGAWIHYETAFTPVQAEFDHLPFAPGEADLAVFNASFHYSPDYEKTLNEALRILRPNGTVVVLDSPVYLDPASGRQMVREREMQFERQYGFRSNALSSENFLTYERLDTLAGALGIQWQIRAPFYGLRWALRPWLARLRGQREPARFLIVAGNRCNQYN